MSAPRSGAIPFDGAYVAADRADNVLVLASLSKSLGLGGPITHPVRNPVLTDLTGNIFVTSPSFGEVDTELGSIPRAPSS